MSEITEYIDSKVEEKVREYVERLDNPRFRIYVFPGGRMPERATDGAVGFDAFLRAVVSPFEMDPDNKVLRKSLFNFKNIPKDNPLIESHVTIYPGDNGKELAYRLDPGESILVGIGCTIEMNFPNFYWVAPRSGLASKWKITVTNAPGTVDPDYRGEAGVLVLNINTQPILVTKNMKIAQLIFQRAIIPALVQIENYEELTTTKRGVGGFGSTGIR